MIKSAKHYRQRLKRKLHCTYTVKDRLLNKFDKMLASYLEDNPPPTSEDLIAAFGPPEEIVQVLMENVSEQERTRYNKRKNAIRFIAVALALVFVLFALYIFFIKEIPMEYTNELIEVTTQEISEVL